MSEQFIPHSKRFHPTFGEDPRRRAIRISNIINPDQILKTAELSQAVVQPELTEQSAGFITRVARAVNSSKVKAVGLLFPIIAGLPACGDNTTVDSTTITPPTTIPATSTTEIPTTTLPPTTEATTTTITVPETTTTTLPADITEPTGEYLTRDEAHGPLPYPVPLGIVSSSELRPKRVEAILTGRLINVYKETVDDFQGQQTEVVFIDLVLGKKSNGDPFIVKFMLGRPDDYIVEIRSLDGLIGQTEGDIYLISDFFENLRSRSNNFSQIRIQYIVDLDEEIKNGCLDPNTFNENVQGCELFLESLEHYNTNKEILNLLMSDNINDNSSIGNGEYGSLIREIHTFPPHT